MQSWVRHSLCGSALVSYLLACVATAQPSAQQEVADLPPPGKAGEQSKPRSAPKPGAPLETGKPNVPEFKPAFPQQTRAQAVKTKVQLKVEELAGGFQKPFALALLPDGRMLVSEKWKGKLWLVASNGEKREVAGIPAVDGRDQGGLLDVRLAPDFADSKNIYLSFYEPRNGGNGLAVVRGRLIESGELKLESTHTVFRMEPTLDSTKHAGGRLVFTPDGKLFITLGDRFLRAGRMQARELSSHFGKVVRVNPDGSVPKDNPYVGKKGARPEIWSRGHRNVLSAALDAQGRLWTVEMGPRGGDELNLVQKGKDYGWPVIGYGEEYSGEPIHESTQAEGMEQPIYYWDPVISPSGLTIHSGKLFPEWKGNFFIGGLSSKALVRLVVEDDRVVGEERLLLQLKQRIREVVEGPDGALYILTDEENGKLYRVTPKSSKR